MDNALCYGYSMKTDTAYEPGTVLSYEDMANPRTVYTVVEFIGASAQPVEDGTYRFSNEYKLRADDGEIIYSDCRQRGWKEE